MGLSGPRRRVLITIASAFLVFGLVFFAVILLLSFLHPFSFLVTYVHRPEVDHFTLLEFKVGLAEFITEGLSD